MYATTLTSLADQLRTELISPHLRFDNQSVDLITDVVPDAGLAWLLNRINATPHPLWELQQLVDRNHRDTVANWLRVPTADAEDVIRAIRKATR